MNILHTVEWYWPSVGGAQEVIRQISERLVKRGHAVTVATSRIGGRPKGPISGVQVEEFAVSGNAVSGFRGEAKRYQDFLLGEHFDIMMNYAAQQWSADLAYPVLDRLTCRKVFAPCGFSGLFDPRYARYFEHLPEHMSRYDHLVFHSDAYRDIQFTREQSMAHYSVIPNGASGEEFATVDATFRQRHGIPEKMPLLLSVCNHTSAKGHGLVMQAFRHARTGPATLVIIGKPIGRVSCQPICRLRGGLITLASSGRKRVLLLDAPRHETLAAYKAADLFVFGSHLECSPLVLFEAVASKTPFISTACGNAEEIATWTGGGVIVPTTRNGDGTVTANPYDMARTIEVLVRDRDRRESIAEAGFNAWRERFTWDHIAGQYEKLYQTLVEKEG
jgi:glycosyltransferase involved in cell wall biosynthesis